MIRINLLPPQSRKEGLLTKKTLGMAVMVEVMIIIVCLYGYGWWRIFSLSEQLQASEQELVLLQPVEFRRMKLEQIEEITRKKTNTLTNITNNHCTLYGILLELGRAIPNNICLTKAEMGQDRIIILEGYALDYNSLTTFNKHLTEDALLYQINLQSCEKVKNDENWQGYLSFVIKANCKE